jgi:hypothetical protein
MPLNPHEKDEFPVAGTDPSPAPITHSVRESAPFFTTVTLAVLLVAIVAAGVYLLYRYGVFAPEPPTQAVQQPPALADPWKARPPSAQGTPSGGSAEAPAPADGSGGAFAVYISSYRHRADAEEEVGRWAAAGFSSFVSEWHGWHRVGFGRYADPGSARAHAEQWKMAFEYGYWIGPSL